MSDFNKAVTDSIFAQARADRPEMTLAQAFEIVLDIVRQANNAGPCPNHEREALEVVTAFYYINVKGDKS